MAIVIVNPRTGKPGGFVSEIVGYNTVGRSKDFLNITLHENLPFCQED